MLSFLGESGRKPINSCNCLDFNLFTQYTSKALRILSSCESYLSFDIRYLNFNQNQPSKKYNIIMSVEILEIKIIVALIFNLSC